MFQSLLTVGKQQTLKGTLPTGSVMGFLVTEEENSNHFIWGILSHFMARNCTYFWKLHSSVTAQHIGLNWRRIFFLRTSINFACGEIVLYTFCVLHFIQSYPNLLFMIEHISAGRMEIFLLLYTDRFARPWSVQTTLQVHVC